MTSAAAPGHTGILAVDDDHLLPISELGSTMPAAALRPGLVSRVWLPTADVVTLVLSIAAVSMVWTPLEPATAAVLAIAWVTLLTGNRSYDTHFGVRPRERGRAVLRAGAGLGLVCWLLPLAGVAAPRPALAVLTGTLVATGICQRLLVGPLVTTYAARRQHVRRVVVAGPVNAVRRAVAELNRAPHEVCDVATVYFTDQTPPRPGESAPVGIADIARVAARHQADAVVALPCPGLDDTDLRRLGWELERTGTALYVSTGMRDVADHRARSTEVAGMRMLHVRPSTQRGVRRAVKAGAERVAAATALTLLLPVLLTIAAAVRLTSSGPAIFRQTRVGQDGHRFTMFKFRTMSTDAERVKDTLSEQNECNEVLFKMRQDPRITKVGALLRRYSLDEVPQLANVVLGHMSLVGPRPALPAEVAKYERDPMRRLAVKPGLTGLWQVSGRSDLSWDDSVRLDLRYVDNWSLGMDATIVLRTVQAVLGHRGAY